MSLKKVVTTGIITLLLGTLLAGCNHNYNSNSNTTERNMIHYLDRNCSTSLSTVRDAIRKRVVPVGEGAKPFQDAGVKSAVLFWDHTIGCRGSQRNGRGLTFENIYQDSYGEPLYVITKAPQVPDLSIKDPTTTGTVKVDGSDLITPELLTQLTKAVGECFQAKVTISKRLDENQGLLTKDDYNTVMREVIKCRTAALIHETNKVN